MAKLDIDIKGMTCDGCARHVEDALAGVGAEDVSVDWKAGRAIVGGGTSDADRLAASLEDTSYRIVGMRRDPIGDGGRSDGERRYDLAVIGSGGGAFAAAIAARSRDLHVAMVERGTIGGTCVNIGCIPSKALLAAAEARHRAGQDRFPGIRTDAGPVDMHELIASKDALVSDMRQDKYIDLIDEYDIDVVEGNARFVEGPALEVDGQRVEAEHFVIATGAEPAIPAIDGLADAGYLTSTTAMELDLVPASMLVIGGGYVAMEQAQLFAHLGTAVTMLVRSQLARGEEPAIADAIRAALEDEGIRIVEGIVPDRVTRRDGAIVAEAGGTEYRAEEILVATGRRPRTDGLGLEDIGVEIGRFGEVRVDDQLRTSQPRVWAAGDVTGHPQFVYVAAKHGALIVANAFDDANRAVDYRSLPRITFTNPTIASAGLTEAQAEEEGIDCTCRTLDLDQVPRALVSRSTRGLVKLVAERDSDRIIGVHILGDGAGDVILAGVYAIQAGMTITDLADAWNPYLTLGEAVHLTALSFTRDPSKLSCCAA